MWAVGLRDGSLVVPMVAVGVTSVIGVVVVVACGRRLLRRRDAGRWRSTPGTILMTSIQVQRTGNVRREVPVVTYAYRVGQDAFQGSRIRINGADRRMAEESQARHVLARYPVGATVRVFYDPDDPSHAVLER